MNELTRERLRKRAKDRYAKKVKAERKVIELEPIQKLAIARLYKGRDEYAPTLTKDDTAKLLGYTLVGWNKMIKEKKVPAPTHVMRFAMYPYYHLKEVLAMAQILNDHFQRSFYITSADEGVIRKLNNTTLCQEVH